MRTFGAFLMIAGANLIAGSLGLAVYLSHTVWFPGDRWV